VFLFKKWFDQSTIHLDRGIFPDMIEQLWYHWNKLQFNRETNPVQTRGEQELMAERRHFSYDPQHFDRYRLRYNRLFISSKVTVASPINTAMRWV